MGEKHKILILSPHTDDAELGCGGTLALLREKGHEILNVAFSDCGRDDIREEFKKASDFLEIKTELKNFQRRIFNENRQEILETLIYLRNNYNPNTVYIPSEMDIHQDHVVITQEAKRAFKHCSLIGYELPWNNYSFHTNFFVKLEKRHIDLKIKALQQYKSQRERIYFSSDFMSCLARIRGTQCGVKYAEAFHIMKIII